MGMHIFQNLMSWGNGHLILTECQLYRNSKMNELAGLEAGDELFEYNAGSLMLDINNIALVMPYERGHIQILNVQVAMNYTQAFATLIVGACLLS